MSARRHLVLWTALVMTLPVAAQEPRSGKRGDELEDKVPAVSGHLFLKAGRHEIAPVLDLSLTDPFRRKYIAGLTYSYHLTEMWAATLRFGYTFASSTPGYVQVCPTPQDCDRPASEALDTLPGNIEMLGGLMVEFSPIYGKLNLIAEEVVHFDLYASAGGGAVAYGLVKDRAPADGIAPGALFAVGQRAFIGEWFAVKLELLDVLYAQPNARADSQLHNQLLFTVGAAFFFPTSFGY